MAHASVVRVPVSPQRGHEPRGELAAGPRHVPAARRPRRPPLLRSPLSSRASSRHIPRPHGGCSAQRGGMGGGVEAEVEGILSLFSFFTLAQFFYYSKMVPLNG